jgi:hypothetical protein
MTSNGPASITAIIQDITDGRPYVFMLMPFGTDWHLYERVKSAVQDVIKLTCIRADDIPGAGFDLLEKIHIAIERSELVIAEVSDRNPNVFYELGFAVGIKKPILLLAQRNVEIPSDLRGRELILHTDDRNGVEVFTRELRNHLQGRLNSQIALLRDMLEAERPQPAYIVASPKYPTEESRITGQPRDYRTFGDNLGVLGLLSAFGSIFGETGGIELVSGQFCSPEMPDRDQNVYLIGSPKVNLATERVMAMIQSNTGVHRAAVTMPSRCFESMATAKKSRRWVRRQSVTSARFMSRIMESFCAAPIQRMRAAFLWSWPARIALAPVQHASRRPGRSTSEKSNVGESISRTDNKHSGFSSAERRALATGSSMLTMCLSKM